MPSISTSCINSGEAVDPVDLMTLLEPSRKRTEGPMQVRIMLQIVGDDGTVCDAEEVASLTKIAEGAEDPVPKTAISRPDDASAS